MGAWGSGVFDNDCSEDWLDAFLEEPGRSRIHEAFEELRESGTDDFDACCEALAAAEVVAALNGKPAGELPEELTEWLRKAAFAPSKTLYSHAAVAVSKILKNSELAELWGEDESWRRNVEDLLRRLGREPKPRSPERGKSFRLTGLSRQLRKITDRAGLAFALRCVMRVQPLIDRCPDISAADKGWIGTLLKRLADIPLGKAVSLNEIRMDSSGERQSYQRLLQCEDAASLGQNRDLAAQCACKAVRLALSTAMGLLLPRVGPGGDGSEQCAQAAKVAAEFADVRTLEPLAADFRYLEQQHPRDFGDDPCPGEPVDVSESGPMGPLWGSAPPDWFQ